MNLIVGSGAGTIWIEYLLYNTINRKDTYYAADESKLITSKYVRFVYSILNHKKTLALKPLLRPIINKNLLNTIDETTEYLIFLNWSDCALDKQLHYSVKRRNKSCKTVFLLTATVKTSMIYISRHNMTLDDVKSLFDVVATFDPNEANKYGLQFVPLMYNGIEGSCNQNQYDVFYIGNAKDRLDLIHETYQFLIHNGIRCCFYVSGVDKSEQLYSDIKYNMHLDYNDVVHISAKSKCILEIVEKSQMFSTIRLGEAILLNKKFITNNESIIEDECYSPLYMMCLNDKDNLINFINSEIPYEIHPMYDVLTKRELIDYLKSEELK